MSKKELKLKNSEIIKSTTLCLGKKCYQPKKKMEYEKNWVDISKNENDFYIYHSFDAKKEKYGGKWYNIDFNLVKSLNEKDKTINNKTVFEDYDTGKLRKYKVEIKIYLSEKGWKKLMKFIG